MLGLEQHLINIKDTSRSASIPNNPLARLMYYLQSVNCLIDFGIPEKYRRFNEYYSLSHEDVTQVLMFAVLLSPDLFVEKNIMICSPKLCGRNLNAFFEISATSNRIAITSEFLVAGRQVHTLQIMAFKKEWIERFYSNPISQYSLRILSIASGTDSVPRYTEPRREMIILEPQQKCPCCLLI